MLFCPYLESYYIYGDVMIQTEACCLREMNFTLRYKSKIWKKSKR